MQNGITQWLKTFLSNMFTEIDNVTWDLTKVLAGFSISVALCLAIYSTVIKKDTFSASDFGQGIATMFAGLGVALGFKKDTTPKE
jgi:hypothetical protein